LATMCPTSGHSVESAMSPSDERVIGLY
jgi:hypothetical protein